MLVCRRERGVLPSWDSCEHWLSSKFAFPWLSVLSSTMIVNIDWGESISPEAVLRGFQQAQHLKAASEKPERWGEGGGCEGAGSAPQPFWHKEPVSGKTIFPWMGRGGMASG